MKLLFSQNYSLTTRLTLLIVLSVLLMWADKTKKVRQTVVDDIAAVVAVPLHDFIDWFPKKYDEWSNSMTSSDTLKTEAQNLRKENRELRMQANRVARLELKVKTYRRLLGAAQEIREETKLVEIYQVTLDPKQRVVKINRGTSDCVIEDQPLIDAYGVMGQVIRTRPYDSTVRLITDRNHIMHVQFKKETTDGKILSTLARGTGKSGLIKLPYLPKSAEIKKGDKVITSGKGGVYPFGVPVGEVIRVSNPAGAKYITAYVKPSAHLDRTREAMVVWTSRIFQHMKIKYKQQLAAKRAIQAEKEAAKNKNDGSKGVKRARVFGVNVKCVDQE